LTAKPRYSSIAGHLALIKKRGKNTIMSTPLRAFVEQAFAAVEAKNLQATLQYFAEDAVLIDPHYPSPVMVGKAAITDGLRWGFGGMKQFDFKIVNYFESMDGQQAAVEIATHHVLQNGRHLQFPQAFFIDVQNNLITRMQAYEPYGPSGIVGVVLGGFRAQRRLRGQRSVHIGKAPGSARR
jgi:ketosteroid isomerase-like protein